MHVRAAGEVGFSDGHPERDAASDDAVATMSRVNPNASRAPRESRRRRRIFLASAIGLSIVTVFAGLSISGDSIEKDVSPPTLHVPESVSWGGSLYGVAMDTNAPIIVTATGTNGAPLQGSPDSTSAPTSNSFCFPVPRGSGLGFIRLTATDPAGNTRVVFIPVR